MEQKGKGGWPSEGMTLKIKDVPGYWKVTRARWEGGGCAHGPHDRYPDGWGITFTQLAPDGSLSKHTFHKYLRGTGCFIDSATIPKDDMAEVEMPPYMPTNEHMELYKAHENLKSDFDALQRKYNDLERLAYKLQSAAEDLRRFLP